MAKVYVLLSGGVDSSTCLASAVQRAGANNVHALSVHYGQIHSTELHHAQNMARQQRVEHTLVDLVGAIGIGGLSNPNLKVPNVSYEELPKGVSPTYVPNRNMLLLATLISRATSDKEAEVVMYGAHAEDSENDAYPDCSRDFLDAMRAATLIATYSQIELEAPFIDIKKWEIVSIGEELGVPWTFTWSCYKGGLIHCGICPTCRARKDAFRLASVEDPTSYAA